MYKDNEITMTYDINWRITPAIRYIAFKHSLHLMIVQHPLNAWKYGSSK
jgi:hypothetical protein